MSDEQTAEERFEAVTMRGIQEGKRLGYNPTRYLMTVKERGAVGAAKQVLREGPIPDGFTTLAHLHQRPDLTTEYTALIPEFRELFTEAELAIAERRLTGR